MSDFENKEEPEVIRTGSDEAEKRMSGIITPEQALKQLLNAALNKNVRFEAEITHTKELLAAAEAQAHELTVVNDRLQASYTSLLAINDALHEQVRVTKPTDDFKYMWIAVIVAGVFMGTIEIIELIASLWQ